MAEVVEGKLSEFSGSLVVAVLVTPRVGRTVDVIGGREVLAAANIVIAAEVAMVQACAQVPSRSCAVGAAAF